MNRIKIEPSKQLFTGNLIDGRSYILGIENRNIYKFHWIKPHFKKMIDNVILNKCQSQVDSATFSKEDVHVLLFLAADGLLKFTVDDELFSDTTLNTNMHEEKINSAEIDNYFKTLLYETNSPFSVKLELTASCNLRCKYCYMRGAKNTFVNSRQWIKVLERLRQLGVVQLDITGGEPLLYEGLSEIVQAADGMGFDTKIYTNGTLIDQSFVELIKSKRINVSISFHSADRDVFERFVQVEDVYSKVINCFKMLSDARATFSAYIVLTSINETTVLDTIAYLEKSRVKFYVSAFIFPNMYTFSNNHEYHPSPQIVANLIKKNYMQERNSKIKCSALKTKFWISCNGDVFTCEMYRHFKVGNILETDIEKIWTSKVANDFRDDISQHISQISYNCDSCKHCLYCNYCPGLCEIYSKT